MALIDKILFIVEHLGMMYFKVGWAVVALGPIMLLLAFKLRSRMRPILFWFSCVIATLLTLFSIVIFPSFYIESSGENLPPRYYTNKRYQEFVDLAGKQILLYGDYLACGKCEYKLYLLQEFTSDKLEPDFGEEIQNSLRNYPSKPITEIIFKSNVLMKDLSGNVMHLGLGVAYLSSLRLYRLEFKKLTPEDQKFICTRTKTALADYSIPSNDRRLRTLNQLCGERVVQ